MPNPDYCQQLNEIWGWPDEYAGDYASLASNVVVGSNPPYSLGDFLAFYPAFGIAPLTPTATLDGSTGVLTNVSSLTGLAAGQQIAGTGIPDDATVVSFGSGEITISKNTTQAGTGVQLTIVSAQFVPGTVLNAYIALASSSLQYARWCELWSFGMSLYVAHFATLWLMAQALTPNQTAAQVATSGLAIGIKTSKSAGDVSLGITPILLADWGAWQLTTYGIQFATFAKSIGSGPMLLI